MPEAITELEHSTWLLNFRLLFTSGLQFNSWADPSSSDHKYIQAELSRSLWTDLELQRNTSDVIHYVSRSSLLETYFLHGSSFTILHSAKFAGLHLTLNLCRNVCRCSIGFFKFCLFKLSHGRSSTTNSWRYTDLEK